MHAFSACKESIMPSPNDPNADDLPLAPNDVNKATDQDPARGRATDTESAGADGLGTGGSAPRDGEK
jgi:hypothetical protein